MATKEKKSPMIDHATDDERLHKLILWNDDYNTFEHVIESLIEVCEHNPYQAETCALIAHFKGKCAVKNGTLEELKPMQAELSIRKLTVDIK